MVVIFLDIDGVLNTERYIIEMLEVEKRKSIRGKYYINFDPLTLENLERIIKHTDAKLVISSTYRFDGLEHLQKVWKEEGYPGDIIGITPHLWSDDFDVPRGCEIDKWLSGENFSHFNYFSDEPRDTKIKNYVIIDDDPDMLLEQRYNFVQTNPYYGITTTEVTKAIDILKSPLRVF